MCVSVSLSTKKYLKIKFNTSKASFQCPFQVTSIGCYADALPGSSCLRDLNGFGCSATNTIGGGTIESCAKVCLSQGFLYFGIQMG